MTAIYFGDLECSYCREFELGAFPRFVRAFVRTGAVKVEYLSLQTASFDADFDAQQSAAYAAGRQDRFWQFAELFYKLQGAEDSGYANGAFFEGLAQAIPGLHYQRWNATRAYKLYRRQLAAEQSLAGKLGVEGTPTIVLEGPKGRDFVGNPYSERALAAAVAKVR